MAGAALSYRLLLAVLGLSAFLLSVPFFLPRLQEARTLEWAPGYWELLPEVGLARIVPFAPRALVNPAAGSGAVQIRESAVIGLPRKY